MLNIIKATYGGADITKVIQAKVNNGKLLVKASNDIFGDLNPGKLKQLIIEHNGGVEIVNEGGYISLPKTQVKKLGIFYTNNNVNNVVEQSLQSLTKFDGIADILTCSWNHINNNPFYEIGAMTRSSNHLNIVIQILQLLYTARKSGNYEYVSFLEHDVLYPDGYFDYPDFDYNTVITNMNYMGICEQGWQEKTANHEPLHQMTMHFKDAISHFEEMLKQAIENGGILVEPQNMQRKQWFCNNPAVHINHGKHFTSHFSIYSKNAQPFNNYWGDAKEWIKKLF